MTRLLSILVMIFYLSVAGVAVASTLLDGSAFLDKISSDSKSGLLGFDDAILYKFHYGFNPSLLPLEYRVDGFFPLRCGTAAIIEYQQVRPRLRSETIDAIEAYLENTEARLAYNSPGGNFLLRYEITGPNAVPILDINPVNGIPDYVERIAAYFDEVWVAQVDEQGFRPPPIGTGRYEISFEDMDYYGFTTVVNSATGLTRIVMHNTFNGFPGNDDPEGAVWGAAKVTAAHEFKHSTQYATSRWSEGGWNEMDAVWAEEFVFSQVNDYYNYLPGESPLRHPEISLDGGATGTGSYEDCVWEIWLSETFGPQIITDFWAFRSLHTYVSVLNSWETVLAEYNMSFAESWSKFAAWNYGTGYRSVPGVGYDEAEEYPYGNYIAYTTSYPFQASGSVDHLAANQIKLLGFAGQMNGALEVEFSGAVGGPMTLSAYIQKYDGTGAIEVATLDDSNNGHFVFSTPLQQIENVGLVVGNAAKSGAALDWSITVSQVAGLPQSDMTLNTLSVNTIVVEGNTATEILELSNDGEPGSVLAYDVTLWNNAPLVKEHCLPGNKSIAGSLLTTATSSYLSGTTTNMILTVYNGSNDEEWLDDVSVDFPVGVTVNNSTDFIGGSLGALASNLDTGNGASINWHGTYGTNEYGVIKAGESASATINYSVDAGFSGDLTINTTISGDEYGQNPHSLSGEIILSPGNPELVVNSPNGSDSYGTDENVTVSWAVGGLVENVNIELSRDGGSQWETLAADVTNSGSLEVVLGAPGSNHCLVRVSGQGGTPSDISDGEFSVFEPVTWLVCSPASGAVAAGQQTDLTLGFNADSLPADTYTAYLVIENDGSDGTVVVPVYFSVTPVISAVPVPDVFALLGNYPNPFNPKTTINFSLDRAGITTIDVLDVRGQKVKKLFQGNLAAGFHSVQWDGRDAGNCNVAAGIYLVRLRTTSHESVGKVVLSK